MLRSIFSRLVEGATVAEAVWATLQGYEFELAHASSNLVVMGLPHMKHVAEGGKGAGKGKGRK
eukprot:351934-Chlamydomonas_euryale.AAC.6